MEPEDLQKARENAINDLTTHNLVYVRSIDFENGYNICFTLLREKSSKEYKGVVRLRRPDGTKALVGQVKLKENMDRQKAILEMIVNTTSLVVDVQEPGALAKITEDRSWEFSDYGEDMEQLIKEMGESGIFETPKVYPLTPEEDGQED